MACVTKKRGRWAVDFYDQHGKRRLKTLPKGSTKAQARELLREIEEQVGKGTWLPTKQIPIFSKVAKDWIEHKRSYVRENTWDVYNSHVKNHFKDLDDLPVNRVHTPMIEKFIRTKLESGTHINTLRKSLMVLSQIMAYAVRHNYIDHNPVRDAERPREQGNEEDSEDKIKILTPKQIKALLQAVDDPKYRTLIKLAIFTGARQGELLGLKWSDVDWDNRQVSIQRTFNNGRFFATKTKASKRKVDLGPTVMTALKTWKLACPANDLGLVFPNEAGRPIDHNNLIRRSFYPALKAAHLPKVRFHDLRHTYASLLIEQGENIKYIQTQLGHSNPTVTWNVYAHLMKPTNQEAACRLEKTVFGDNGDQMETTGEKLEAGNATNS